MSWNSRLAVGISVTIALIVPGVDSAGAGKPSEPTVEPDFAEYASACTDGICGSGSTVGPDGFLYVTDSTGDSTGGRIQRIDPRSGAMTTYADGLPRQIAGVGGGGVVDVAFLGRTAYVLVTGTSEFWTEWLGSPNPAAEGIYRLDSVGAGTTHATLIADLYTWSEQNPPEIDREMLFIPGGYTYALEQYKRGFLVTDGHHNRVLRVEANGAISVFHDFAENIVPTGLETKGPGVLVGQAGPVPHDEETGRVVALSHKGRSVTPIASGARLLVDVEVGRGNRVYGLSQGEWPVGGQEGFPADPNTGYLMVADRNGEFQNVVETTLDRPTTFEIIKDTAYVITISGKVLKITGLR